MNTAWAKIPIGEVVSPVERTEVPIPGKYYRQIGVRLWGQGAYEREILDGGQTRYQELYRVETGDIIVNKIWARNGSVAVVNGELAGCFCSGEFPIYAPDRNRIEPRWFHWITKTSWFWYECDLKSRGTSGKNRIRPEKFLEIQIPLPSLEEQRRIAAKVDELAGKIKEAQGLRQQAVEIGGELVGAKAASVFRSALKGGSRALHSVATLERGKFSHRPRNEPRFFGGAHPWIQIGEIESSTKFICHWTQTLNDDGLAISKKFPRGTVLISIAATIGAVGILDFDCCVPDSIVGVTPGDGIDSEFIYYYLGYLRQHLEEIAPQSAQKNINLQILSELPVPRLMLSEQRRIVEELDALQAEENVLKRLQAETAAELDTLLPSILDKAFKGEL